MVLHMNLSPAVFYPKQFADIEKNKQRTVLTWPDQCDADLPMTRSKYPAILWTVASLWQPQTATSPLQGLPSGISAVLRLGTGQLQKFGQKDRPLSVAHDRA